MLKIGQKREPVRITLREAVPAAKGQKAEPEAFVVMAPISRAMRRRASGVARVLLGDIADINEVSADLLFDVAEKGSRELIRLGAIEWGGIGDADGNPLPLTPDLETRFATARDADRPTGTIDMLLDDDAIFETIEAAYTRPDAMRGAEKNGLSGSPNGTGAVATPGKTTANSPAKPKAKTTAAPRAPTSKTGPGRQRAKKPGKH